MNTITKGIIYRGEDPELRRHRTEVLEKSRVWRILIALALLVTVVFAAVVLARLVLG